MKALVGRRCGSSPFRFQGISLQKSKIQLAFANLINKLLISTSRISNPQYSINSNKYHIYTFKEVMILSADKRSNPTPAEQEIEKKLNPDSDSKEHSDLSESKKLIDKEIESDDK